MGRAAETLEVTQPFLRGTPVAAACRIITLEDQLAEHTGPPGPGAQS